MQSAHLHFRPEAPGDLHQLPVRIGRLLREIVVDDLHRIVLLQHPLPDAERSQLPVHGCQILFRKQSLVDGGADVQIDSGFERQADALLHPFRDRFIPGSGQLRVPCGRRLVVDPHGVHTDRLKQSLHPVGEGAVGIHLGQVVAGADVADEFPDIFMQHRFAAGDHHPFDQPPAVVEKSEELLFRHPRLTGRVEDQAGIVTERAAQVASAGEDDAADPPGIVDQCELVEPS